MSDTTEVAPTLTAPATVAERPRLAASDPASAGDARQPVSVARAVPARDRPDPPVRQLRAGRRRPHQPVALLQRARRRLLLRLRVSGQFAFSQAAFAAVGGYISSWATRRRRSAPVVWVGSASPASSWRASSPRVRTLLSARPRVLPRDRDPRAVGDHPRDHPPVERIHRRGRRHHGVADRPLDRPLTSVRDRRSRPQREPLLGVVRCARAGDAGRDLAGPRGR